MNILHIGDQAGVAATFSHFANSLGHNSHVYNLDSWDNLRIGEYYRNTQWFNTPELAVRCEDSVDYDEVFVHDLYPYIEHLEKLDTDFHYVFHGNNLRQAPNMYDKVRRSSNCKKIWISTEDLHPLTGGTATLFRRPIDIELFSNKGSQGVGALCITQERYQPQVEGWYKNYMPGEDRTIYYRDKHIIPYKDMPDYLRQFKYYIDLKYAPTHPPTLIKQAISQTALQALSCGLSINSNNIEMSGWDYRHDGLSATSEIIEKITI